jgi:hypothetical protein
MIAAAVPAPSPGRRFGPRASLRTPRYTWPMVSRRTFLLSSAAVLSGCRRKRLTPEAQIRAAVAALEAAVEDKDVGAARELISETFTGEEVDDRRAAVGLLTAVLTRYPHVHLLTRVVDVDFLSPASAHVKVTAAAAGHPLKGFDDLARVGADILTFELSFVEEEPSVWRITRATWRSGEPQDFVTGADDSPR